MKNILLTITLILSASYYYLQDHSELLESVNSEKVGLHSEIYSAFANRQSDVQVFGSGRVVKVLADDTKGRRHQRFIVKLPSGLSVLIAHNIDLAPRIPRLKPGDEVGFFGEYEWNEKGGVVHWTHHDPYGRHPGGWLEHRGRKFQ